MREELKNWLLAEDAEDQHKGQAPIEFLITCSIRKRVEARLHFL